MFRCIDAAHIVNYEPLKAIVYPLMIYLLIVCDPVIMIQDVERFLKSNGYREVSVYYYRILYLINKIIE